MDCFHSPSRDHGPFASCPRPVPRRTSPASAFATPNPTLASITATAAALGATSTKAAVAAEARRLSQIATLFSSARPRPIPCFIHPDTRTIENFRMDEAVLSGNLRPPDHPQTLTNSRSLSPPPPPASSVDNQSLPTPSSQRKKLQPAEASDIPVGVLILFGKKMKIPSIDHINAIEAVVDPVLSPRFSEVIISNSKREVRLACNRDSDEIILSTGRKLERKNLFQIFRGEARVEWMWTMLNQQGYFDGFRIQISAEGRERVFEFISIASCIDIYEATNSRTSRGAPTGH